MNSLHQIIAKNFLVIIALTPLIICYPQKDQNNDKQTEHRPGRYVPELHGATLGKWMPDYRGLYQHMKVPYDGGYGDRGQNYDGGYGDRGQNYEHVDVREIVRAFQQKNPNVPFALGPQDHLRFMIDFNYDGTGWQLIKFEWIRDGEDERHYNYVNENKLWETPRNIQQQQQSIKSGYVGYDYGSREPGDAAAPDLAPVSYGTAKPMVNAAEDEVTHVHVDGQADKNNYNVTYSEQDKQHASNDPNVQVSIREVLDYIVRHIIPTLS